jgi:hypothetical protein
MKSVSFSEDMKKHLENYIREHPDAELVSAYLFYIQNLHHLQPVLFPVGKIIYQNSDEAVSMLEKQGKLWHETEIKVQYGEQSVNDKTKKIYICPFTGKVFGDNTHPNPQDAIYDWVSKCPENKERIGGLPVKRFLVSEDPEVIKNYMEKLPPQKIITKVVYSSSLSGKLFNSKDAVIADFKKNYLKPLTLEEVQNQNRFEIEERFLDFIQKQLVEDKITQFVESMAEIPEFQPVVEKWIE